MPSWCFVLFVMSAKRKWYSVTERVDIETGEILSKSRIEREDWVKVGQDERVEFKPTYNIKYLIYHYEKSRQLRIF